MVQRPAGYRLRMDARLRQDASQHRLGCDQMLLRVKEDDYEALVLLTGRSEASGSPPLPAASPTLAQL